ncbi:MAG: hypothetical protein AAGK78_10960 [Planctomycetota bacterium]
MKLVLMLQLVLAMVLGLTGQEPSAMAIACDGRVQVVTSSTACCCTGCGCTMDDAPRRPVSEPIAPASPRFEVAPAEPGVDVPPAVVPRVEPSRARSLPAPPCSATKRAAILCVWTT